MELQRDELLISRVVDGDATGADWAELELLAANDRRVWARLAATLKNEAATRRAIESELSRADAIELPHAESLTRETATRRAGGWGVTATGWAAALLFAGLWLIGLGTTSDGDSVVEREDPTPIERSTSDSTLTADAALLQYLEAGTREGRLVQDLPSVVLETRSLPDRRAVEVLYMRRLVERKTVDEFFEVSRDELGTEVVQPVDFDRVDRRQAAL